MLIFSWNVAGWKTTVQKIHENYSNEEECVVVESNSHGNDDTNNSSTTAVSAAVANNNNDNNIKSKKKKMMNPLSYFLQRHGDVDIFCLQEHKIPKQQLIDRKEPLQSSHIPGYESFWSCCTDENKKGLNGVVTYCKTGLVVAANAAPLEPVELNHQGRCVMTDHGTFCLFNVYVPASGNGHVYKLKFLQALQRAMQYQRNVKKKAVILVGDLNITHTKEDVYWKDRDVHVQDVLDEVANASSSSSNDMEPWKCEVTRYWPMIQQVMSTKQAIPTKTTNSLTKETYNKFRLQVVTVDPAADNNQRRVFLGSHESTPDECLHYYDFTERTYTNDNDDTDEVLLAREANVVSVGILAELMTRIANLPHWGDTAVTYSNTTTNNNNNNNNNTPAVPLVGEALQRHIANTYAREARGSPTRTWLTNLLKDDDMVDVFRHFYPTAQGRFTCWHQFTNQRYINNGYRLDYTIVDRSLLGHVLQGPPSPELASSSSSSSITLRCCRRPENSNTMAASAAAASSTASVGTAKAVGQEEEKSSKEVALEEDPLGETAALRAATANGRFQPASFQGGGIHEASREALDTQFWGSPHSGMVYTPPSFSDHIAVTLLMDDHVMSPSLVLNDKDAATRKAQPHKVQKSIASFFAAGSNTTTAVAKNKNSKTTLIKTKNGVPAKKSFFTKLSSSTSSTTTTTAPPMAASSMTASSKATKKSTVRSASTQAPGNSCKRPKKSSSSANNNQSSILSHFQKQQDKS